MFKPDVVHGQNHITSNLLFYCTDIYSYKYSTTTTTTNYNSSSSVIKIGQLL